jgi:hypothetical protein
VDQNLRFPGLAYLGMVTAHPISSDTENRTGGAVSMIACHCTPHTGSAVTQSWRDAIHGHGPRMIRRRIPVICATAAFRE